MPASAAGYITDVDYIPGFYPHMSPVAMRYAASLNRVVPPATAERFRYLELGCGLGRSLTTLAAANPQGEFVGIDVNASHIAAIEKDIAAGELANARAIASDFAALPKDLGRFEFLALHGVFSWVAPEVRQQILEVAREHLAPGGLLLVSYNAMPGWAHLQPIRGILRQYAALRQGDTVQRIRDALRLSSLFCFAFGALVAVVLWIAGGPLAALFSDAPRVVAAASHYLWIVPLSYGGAGVVMNVNAAFNGQGLPGRAVAVSLLRMLGVYLPAAYLGAWLVGLEGIFAAAALANISVGLGAYLWHRRACQDPAVRRFLVPRARHASVGFRCALDRMP